MKSNSRNFKRLVAIGDLHCGHFSGLTPPQYNSLENAGDKKAIKLHHVRRAIWQWYTDKMRDLQPIDILVVGGDCIDGRGEKSGSTELIAVSQQTQCEMAAQCILAAKAEHIVMVYGTCYHVSHGGEDWEDIIADQVAADKIGAHEWVDVNGCVFDIKHKIGFSSSPVTGGTALRREQLWNLLWKERGECPRADILLRFHVHVYSVTGDADFTGYTCPSMQGYGSKYGSRECSRTVDVGLMTFDIGQNGRIMQWDKLLARLPEQRATALKF